MRDCNKCIHHTSGSCSSFDCKMQTVEDVVKEAREKAIIEFAERLKPYLNTYYDRVQTDRVAEQMKGEKE